MTETSKYRSLVWPYLTGAGIDVGCGEELVLPTAIGVDLDADRYLTYTGSEIGCAAHIRCSADALPFATGTLDYVYSSHLLEDFEDWKPVLSEWWRVLKPGGHLVVLIPDRERFRAAVAVGQLDNPNHKHEGRVGELSETMQTIGSCTVLEDRLTNLTPTDYTIMFVGRKTT